MQKIDEYISKDGSVIDIILPIAELTKELTDFVNALSKEDTFLSFAGETYTLDQEKAWIMKVIEEIKQGKNFVIWATINGKIIGNADIRRGMSARDFHVGTIGLMVAKEYRGQGLGEFLIKRVISEAKKMKLKIAKLDVFSDNEIAKNLYHKIGFAQYGSLPNGFYRQNRFTDKIEMYLNLDD